MKASGSVLSSGLAALYLAAHLPFLAPSLEDLDSINFALGLREFDVTRHQPHPPGYPVYIALGRLSQGVIDRAAGGLEQVRAEALALAIWSALAGAVAVVAAGALYRALDADRRLLVPLLATVLLALAPLFWMSGLRPMSDLPGLALALGSQALLVKALCGPQHLAAATFLAAIAAGVRVQTAWLTLPLLAAVLMVQRRAHLLRAPTPSQDARTSSHRAPTSSQPAPTSSERAPGIRRNGAPLWQVAMAGVAGVAIWLVPLMAASGGPDNYWRALGVQAGEDFAWVDMLWANPAPRRLAFALYETFVMPWGALPLAVIVGVAAAAGAIVLALRHPRALLLTAIAFAPYAIFHLLFQETRHVRYALPLLPAVTWLAAVGVAALGRPAPLAGAALCASAAWVALPGMAEYASEPHPAFRAIADMESAAAKDRPAAVFAHYSLRRPLQARPPASVAVVDSPRTNEWAGLVDYWRGGGTAPVWFLADPRRTDLAVIDPRAREDVRHYRWKPAARPELSGARPSAADWYRFEPPGWFVGEGWSLTPELGGMTRLAGSGVDRRPIEAYVRRRAGAMVAIVGSRHLGLASDGAIVLTAAVDGAAIDEWILDPAHGPNVLRILELPPGALEGDGKYARFVVSARSAEPEKPTPAAAIRQFDIQPATGLVYAFDEGWHEEEYDNTTGLRWRWSSGRSVLRVVPPQGVRIRLRGESPLRYQGEPPAVRVRAGDRTIAETRPNADFDWTVDVPNDDARAAGGRITLETAPVYRPGAVEGTSDPRQLGLRLFDIDVLQSNPD